MHHTRQHFFFWNWSLKNCNERFFLGKFSNLYRVGIQKIPTFFPFNFVRVRHLLHLHVKINNLCGISNVNIACWLQIWKKIFLIIHDSKIFINHLVVQSIKIEVPKCQTATLIHAVKAWSPNSGHPIAAVDEVYPMVALSFLSTPIFWALICHAKANAHTNRVFNHTRKN